MSPVLGVDHSLILVYNNKLTTFNHAYHHLHSLELGALWFLISAASLKQLDLDYLANGQKIIHTKSQIIELERNFQCTHNLQSSERFAIAYQLSLPEKAVKDWFENRLKKFKSECAQENITIQAGPCGRLINIHNDPFMKYK